MVCWSEASRWLEAVTLGGFWDFCLSYGIFGVAWFHREDHWSDYVVRSKSQVWYTWWNSLWSRLLVCQLVMVRTLSGGELGILLRGSTTRSSAVRELVKEIYGADTWDLGYWWIRRGGLHGKMYEYVFKKGWVNPWQVAVGQRIYCGHGIFGFTNIEFEVVGSLSSWYTS